MTLYDDADALRAAVRQFVDAVLDDLGPTLRRPWVMRLALVAGLAVVALLVVDLVRTIGALL